MKKILIPALLFISAIVVAQTPSGYAVNDHVSWKVDSIEGKYRIQYTFKDHFEKLRTFKLYFNKYITNKDIARYGVPKSFYDNISARQFQAEKRMKAIKRGLYTLEGALLKPDRSAIVSFYRPYCRAIAGGINYLLMQEGCDTRKNRIEMALKFVQDIPYGVPEIADSLWEVHGIYPPPELLLKMHGDCDSKAILAACILSYLINIKDFLFLYQGRTHALIAIKGLPETSQSYIEVEGNKFIIADVTGPSRLLWGNDGNSFSTTLGYKIERVKIRNYWFRSKD